MRQRRGGGGLLPSPGSTPLAVVTDQAADLRRMAGGTTAGSGMKYADCGANDGGTDIRKRVDGEGLNSVHGEARGGPSRSCSSTLSSDRVALRGDRDGHDLVEQSSAARDAHGQGTQPSACGRGASSGWGEAEATACGVKRRRISGKRAPAAVGPWATAGGMPRDWAAWAGRPPDTAGGSDEGRLTG